MYIVVFILDTLVQQQQPASSSQQAAAKLHVWRFFSVSVERESPCLSSLSLSLSLFFILHPNVVDDRYYTGRGSIYCTYTHVENPVGASQRCIFEYLSVHTHTHTLVP